MPLVPNPDIFGPATLAVTQGVSAFNAFLPRFSDVRKNHPESNPDFAADVRMGEVAAVTVTLGIGMIASSLTGSSMPALTALTVCIILVCLYESTLRADRPMEPKTLVPSGNGAVIND